MPFTSTGSGGAGESMQTAAIATVHGARSKTTSRSASLAPRAEAVDLRRPALDAPRTNLDLRDRALRTRHRDRPRLFEAAEHFEVGRREILRHVRIDVRSAEERDEWRRAAERLDDRGHERNDEQAVIHQASASSAVSAMQGRVEIRRRADRSGGRGGAEDLDRPDLDAVIDGEAAGDAEQRAGADGVADVAPEPCAKRDEGRRPDRVAGRSASVGTGV